MLIWTSIVLMEPSTEWLTKAQDFSRENIFHGHIGLLYLSPKEYDSLIPLRRKFALGLVDINGMRCIFKPCNKYLTYPLLEREAQSILKWYTSSNFLVNFQLWTRLVYRRICIQVTVVSSQHDQNYPIWGIFCKMMSITPAIAAGTACSAVNKTAFLSIIHE